MDVKAEACGMIDASHEAMLALWEKLVNIDCGPGCKEGVDQIAVWLEQFLQPLGFKTRQIPHENAGNTLVAEWGDMSKPYILLIGHMDTVFKAGTVRERKFTITDGKAYGPGVLDMKGGIVIALFAVQSLLKSGYAGTPIKFVLAGDEEVGHVHSNTADCIMAESEGAKCAFNFETGFMDNGLVTKRKGMYQFMVEVFGRGAHTGNDPENGRSAIKEMAKKIWDIEAIKDEVPGINMNVGVIEGGTVANAVPAYAKILCDLRFDDFAQLETAEALLAKTLEKQYVPDTVTKMTPVNKFREMQVLPGTQALLDEVVAAAEEAGLPVPKAKAVGGASDSAYTTAAGITTICAMGVQGGRNHTTEEFAVIDTLFERAKLLIGVLTRL